MRRLRVLFAGTPEVAVPSLHGLLQDERFEVVGVLTNPDRPRGRSGTPVASPVARTAREAGLPLFQPQKIRDEVGRLVDTGAEIGAVVAYGTLLPGDVLETLPLGFVNLHFSLLPRWRGAAPVQHAIRAGDVMTGITCFRLETGMDTGPILRQMAIEIPNDADAGEVLSRLAVQGGPMLRDALLAVRDGEPGTPQDSEAVTLAPRILPQDCIIDWTRSAGDVDRLVRSVSPKPGAVTTYAGGVVKLAEVRTVVEPGSGGAPGTLLGTDGDGILVACGSGALRVAKIQIPGRTWTRAADQVRGRRLVVGETFGGSDSGS